MECASALSHFLPHSSKVAAPTVAKHCITEAKLTMVEAAVVGAFFCIFDPLQGSKVMCQVPDGIVIPTATSEVESCINFDEVRNYVIPKPPLCNKLLSLRVGQHRILGYPINIVGKEYERNSFTFNIVVIVSSSASALCYESAVARVGKMAKVLEEQLHYISNKDNIHDIDAMVEQLFQDINNFSECQIPWGPNNKVNLKIFPVVEAPPEVKGHHVPIATVRLNNLLDESWDPTMERIVPFINGINSVRRIADLAEADFDLTRQCISHFIHYDCVVIIGIFQFSNIYAPTPAITSIISDVAMYYELIAFVYHAQKPNSGSSFNSNTSSSSNGLLLSKSAETPKSFNSSLEAVSNSKLGPREAFELYAAFGTGQSVYTWYNERKETLQDFDVRRFMVYGIIKGLISRVYSYPVFDYRNARPPTDMQIARALKAAKIPDDKECIELIKTCLERPLHFDELCTTLRAPRIKVSKLLRTLGEWTIINR